MGTQTVTPLWTRDVRVLQVSLTCQISQSHCARPPPQLSRWQRAAPGLSETHFQPCPQKGSTLPPSSMPEA